MSSTVGKGRILIIPSWNGPRHHTQFRPAEMLRIQARQLKSLKHSLDKVLIVRNIEPGMGVDDDYESALGLFPDVLTVSNVGSYGGWKEGYLANPTYEWYIFIEDDYTFNLDNFDQKWIDLWEPQMTYLCQQVGEAGYEKHAACSAGLTKGEVLQTVDWSGYRLDIGQYNSQLQVQWSKLFGNEGLYDYTFRYNSVFWTGNNLTQTDPNKPALLVPMQLI